MIIATYHHLRTVQRVVCPGSRVRNRGKSRILSQNVRCRGDRGVPMDIKRSGPAVSLLAGFLVALPPAPREGDEAADHVGGQPRRAG
jgi:hypothetical protein